MRDHGQAQNFVAAAVANDFRKTLQRAAQMIEKTNTAKETTALTAMPLGCAWADGWVAMVATARAGGWPVAGPPARRTSPRRPAPRRAAARSASRTTRSAPAARWDPTGTEPPSCCSLQGTRAFVENSQPYCLSSGLGWISLSKYSHTHPTPTRAHTCKHTRTHARTCKCTHTYAQRQT